MKKFLTLFLTLLILSSSCFAEENLVSFSIGLSSGVPFYGSEKIQESKKKLEDGQRIILGTLFELRINPIQEVSFFLGTDLLSDFNNYQSYSSNHLCVDIPFGIKLYPGLLGFCIGISYNFGFRTDFFNLEETGKENLNSAWGNGFKILAEYNFAHKGNSKYLPTIGVYWKRMPRGENTFDNNLCAYVCANF